MSILDGMPSSQDEIKGAEPFAAVFADLFRERIDALMTPRVRSVLTLMGEGVSLAQMAGITRPERDAVFLQACRLLQFGEARRARDILLPLYQLEPLDARVMYVLAATYQHEGDVATAGKLYVQCLALDATSVEGHLRLGECFLAAREYDNATQMFEVAISLSRAGHGAKAQIAYAQKMLTCVQECAPSSPRREARAAAS